MAIAAFSGAKILSSVDLMKILLSSYMSLKVGVPPSTYNKE